MKNSNETIVISEETIKNKIYFIRGQKVMFDFDLAEIYGYETKRFNEQVKNNIEKFPKDFMFQLSKEEKINLTMSKESTRNSKESSWSKKSTLNKSGNLRGFNTKYLPYAFTEQGIYMLMTVLRGELATKQSLALIRLFKQMKDYIIGERNLAGYNGIVQLTKDVEKNKKDIIDIKRDLKIVMDNFIDPNTYKHFLIFNGERIEADFAYQSIYGLAKKSIIIIDDYIDIKTLKLLKVVNNEIDVLIISDNKAKNSLSKEFINDFIKDTKINLAIEASNGKVHDRYIFIDMGTSNEATYHCGTSSKDAGNKITTIVKLEDHMAYEKVIDYIKNN